MDKIFKLTLSFFLLSLLALPFTGCDNPPWESASILVLKIDAPSNGNAVTTPTVTVNGRLGGTESSGAKVTVNGADVPVNDRKFSTDVKLNEGKNVINIGAKQGAVDLAEQVTVIYNPAK